MFRALAILMAFFIFSPSLSFANWEAAMTFYMKGEYEKAAFAFSQIIEQNDTIAEYHDFYGRSLYFTEDYSEAVNELNRAEGLYDRADSMLYYYRGSAYLNMDRQKAAQADFVRFADTRPTDFNALNILCIQAYRMRDFPEAETICGRAFEVKKTNQTAYKFQGLSQLQLDEYMEALINFQTLCSVEPDNPEHWYLLGIGLEGMNNPKLAKRAYRRSIDTNPNYDPSYLALADLHRRSGSADSGIAIMEELVEANPDSLQYALELGYHFYGAEEYEKALFYYNHVLDRREDDSTALRMIAYTYYKQEDYLSSSAAFKDYLELHPRDAGMCNMAGMSYLAMPNPTEAKNYFKQATIIDPGYGQAHYNLGRVHRLLDNIELATSAFQDALQSVNDPKLLEEIYFQLGECNDMLGESGKAIVAFDEVLKLNPRRAKALEYLGNIFYLEGDYWEAVDYFDRLSSVDESAINYYKLGLSYMGAKDYYMAVANFESAVGLDPEHYSSYYNMGNTYAYIQDYDMALMALDQAMALEPENAELLMLMAYCYKENKDKKTSKIYVEMAKAIDPEAVMPYQ